MSKKPAGPVDLRHEASNNRGIHKDLRAMMTLAAEYDWTGRRTGKGGIQISSPDGEVTAYLPLRTSDPGRLTQDVERKIERWYKGRAQAAVKEAYGVTPDDVEISDGPNMTARCKEHGIEFASWEAYSAHVRKEHKSVSEKKEIDESMDDLLTHLTDDDMADALVEAEAVTEDLAKSASTSGTMATSESVRPYLAKGKRHGDIVSLYESESVLEVTSGDKVSYRCPLCSFERDKPGSVSAHYGKMHVQTGEVEPVTRNKPYVVEGVEAERVYTRYKRAKGDLSREIYNAMRSRSRRQNGTEPLMSWCNALAEKIMEARGEEPDAEPVVQDEPIVQVEGTPITVQVGDADSVVSQIRGLVAPDLVQELEEAKAAKEEAEAKANALRENVRTLASLVTEETE